MILGGAPVFKGTRVPVKSLFEYLERGYTLEKFVECFPSVTKEMAAQALENLDKRIPEDFFKGLRQGKEGRTVPMERVLEGA